MKQHITVDQLLSLTPEQQERLREWWVPQVGDQALIDGVVIVLVRDDGGTWRAMRGGVQLIDVHKSDCLPLLSIGQCVELLGNKCCFTINNAWRVSDWEIIRYDKPAVYCSPEPIDALFAAVREVL